MNITLEILALINKQLDISENQIILMHAQLGTLEKYLDSRIERLNREATEELHRTINRIARDD